MACKEETRTIGDNSYYCRQWDAEKALLMKLKLGKMFGAAFSTLAVAITNGVDKDVVVAINAAFNDKEPEEILALLKEVVESATCNKERITLKNFNEIFSDNLLEFYKVFAFVLEVNYKNFLGGKLPDILSKMQNKIKSDNET